jgi:transposase-like protein
MSKHRKHWKSQEKLEIVNYYKQHGMAKTKREFEVSSTSIYNWEELYDEHGASGLLGKKSLKSSNESEELKRLRRENDALKKIVAEKELILRIKNELLKKSK